MALHSVTPIMAAAAVFLGTATVDVACTVRPHGSLPIPAPLHYFLLIVGVALLILWRLEKHSRAENAPGPVVSKEQLEADMDTIVSLMNR